MDDQGNKNRQESDFRFHLTVGLLCLFDGLDLLLQHKNLVEMLADIDKDQRKNLKPFEMLRDIEWYEKNFRHSFLFREQHFCSDLRKNGSKAREYL